MRYLFFCIALLLPYLPGNAVADVPEEVVRAAAALRDSALASNRAYDTTVSLVTEVGPRFAGTSGDAASIAWGLKALRDQGFQNVRTEPVEVPRWIRGSIEVEITGPFPQPLVALALGGSIGTPDEGIEAPVLMVRDLDELAERSDAEIAGKIIFFNRRMERLQDGSDYGRTVPIRTQGPSAAALRGAVGVIIRSVGTSNERVAHTGGTRYQEGVTKIPAAAISNPDADLLERQVSTGRAVTLHMHLTARELPPGRSANVIGEIPGRGARASELVILGCHLDSWDITPGAHDDAVGCGIVMEAARIIGAQRRNPPLRTIRVVLYANEEFGLSGARAYAAAHGEALDRHVLALGADNGSGGPWRFDSGVAEDALPVIEVMTTLLEPLDIPFGSNSATGIADFIPIRELGVPVLDVRQDMRPYFDIHHTINDTVAKLDRAEIDRNVAAYVALLYVAAYTGADFGRHPSHQPAE